jgi:hypothetical protein
MWAIFQLQDLLGMSETLRRENPHDERINVPAIAHHYWRYRMHLTLEQLLQETTFNERTAGLYSKTAAADFGEAYVLYVRSKVPASVYHLPWHQNAPAHVDRSPGAFGKDWLRRSAGYQLL